MTHYYFDDCAYCTPMLSEPFAGRIAFRRPIDITSGNAVANRPNGAATPPTFIDFAKGAWPQAEVSRHEFDRAAYLAANPDVAKAGTDPWEHWRKHGQREGRPLRSTKCK